MKIVGYFLHDGVDKDGNLRELIVFNLAPVETPGERLEELRIKTRLQTKKASKIKPQRILLCPKCGQEYLIEEHEILQFCKDCGTFLSKKIRYE